MQKPEIFNATLESRIKSLIRNIPDFPKPGIIFRDITPVLLDYELCNAIVDEFLGRVSALSLNAVCAIESRGFFFGTLLANRLKLPFIPIRKEGKLPGDTISYTYDLEYGTSTIEIHDGVLKPGDRVLLHDDLLATGGTIMAAMELIQKQQAEVAAVAFLVSLEFLEGPKKLKKKNPNVIALAKYH
ncbi:MAG TPA: adenine phosphoribosyltransferase [Chitinophagales bacterium]|nr:adenine phosphoribosyltransferase [Chitinophagales bacterium]